MQGGPDRARGGGLRFQLVTDPDPTRDRYHAPLQAIFRIDDLRKLEPVRPEVDRAALGARKQPVATAVMLLLLVGSWIAWLVLHRAASR